MEFINPFETEGIWYKGNTHLHTTNSDGALTPEEICKIYKEAGYDFISITDHRKITTPQNSPDDLLIISGAELDSERYHIVALNLKEIFDGEGLSPQEIINKIYDQNALAIVGHPYWSALTSKDLFPLKNYIGIEVYNSTCEKAKGKGYSSVHWDEILQEGKKVWGFAVDDTHHHFGEYREDDILGSFIMVKAKSLSIENICSSIKNGNFYSSTGVIIKDLKVENNRISVEFSPSCNVDFIGYGFSGERFSGKGEEITHVEYEIKGNEKYLRIEITDKNNKKAWTNPIFI